MYLSPCFTTVPENVWLPSGFDDAADPEGFAVLEPDSGAVASGVEEDGGCAEGVCEDGACEAGGCADWSGVLLGGVDGLCEDGLCDDGVCEDSGVLGVLDDGACEDGVCVLGAGCAAGGISGDGGCCVCGCCWSAGDDGVDWALSALPQEIIPMAIARVARNERV